MKKLQLVVVFFLISLSICLFAITQAVIAAGSATVSVPTLSPVSPITLGDSVTASVIVGGVGRSPAGTITFQYSTDNGATWNALGAPKKLSKGSATSDPYAPNAAGSNFRIRANYSGDAKYGSAIGNAASLTVKKANPTVPAPTLNPISPISLGGLVTAVVTISGVSGVTPTGTVKFQYSTNSDSTWVQLGAVKTLSSGSATSDPYAPNAAGSNFRIRANYSGDSNYNNATGGAATLTVNKANPTVPSPSVSPKSVVVNNPVTVSATIAGVSDGVTPTGTATFQVKIGTGLWTAIGSAVSLSSGSASTIYVPQTIDSYQFQVVYSGDSNYKGATGSAVSVTVNFPPLDHFVFSSVGTQTAGTSFSITITAKDVYGNTVAGYVGTPSLSYSAGSISPNVMGAFSAGVGSASVTVTAAGSSVTITAVDGTRAGTSNSFAVTLAPTPTPSQTLSPTYTPSPTATPRHTSSPTPTPTSTLSPNPTTNPSPSPSPTASPSENSASLPPEIVYYEIVVVLITTIIITTFAINIYYFKTPYNSLKA